MGVAFVRDVCGRVEVQQGDNLLRIEQLKLEYKQNECDPQVRRRDLENYCNKLERDINIDPFKVHGYR